MKAGELNTTEWVIRWPQVRLDQFTHLDMMNVPTMDALQKFAESTNLNYGWTHRINSDYRPGDTGEHGDGDAIDAVFYLNKPGDIPVIDQFVMAAGSGLFRRVGLYPFWNTPGLHLDIKPQTLYWWRDAKGTYHYGSTLSKILTWR